LENGKVVSEGQDFGTEIYDRQCQKYLYDSVALTDCYVHVTNINSLDCLKKTFIMNYN